MGRNPVGETAMTAAERQRRRREKLKPPFDADNEALDLKLAMEGRNLGDEQYRALIVAMIQELDERSFVTSFVTDGWEFTVTVSVTERLVTPEPLAREIAERLNRGLDEDEQYMPASAVMNAKDADFDLDASPPGWVRMGVQVVLDDGTAGLVRQFLKMRKEIVTTLVTK